MRDVVSCELIKKNAFAMCDVMSREFSKKVTRYMCGLVEKGRKQCVTA
jgi:hypothetical protein